MYYHKITNLLRRQCNLHISSPISNCLTLIWCWKEAHSRRGSERRANQLKAFRSHNGPTPGFQDFTRKGFKGEKKSDGKRDFLKQKSLFDRDNTKLRQFLLLLVHWAAVREFEIMEKYFLSLECGDVREVPILWTARHSSGLQGQHSHAPSCWIIHWLHFSCSNPLQRLSFFFPFKHL